MRSARAFAPEHGRAAEGTEQKVRSNRRRRARLVLAAATAALLAVGLTGCHPRRWQSQLASVNAAGADSGDQPSRLAQLSRDGTKVLFESNASNLGPADTNGATDIYVRDLTTGVTELVSVNAAGTGSGDGRSYFPGFNRDATKVAFRSQATNLTAPPPRAVTDVYVRDLVTDTTTAVSVDPGTPGAQAGVGLYEFHPNGDKILFGVDEAPGVTTLFEQDLMTGIDTKLMADAGYDVAYSPSGDALALFNRGKVYLREASTGGIREVPSGPSGLLDGIPVFSHDGTKLAFTRRTDSAGAHDDIYVYDRVTQSTSLVTVDVGGRGGSNNIASPIHGFHPTDANRLLFSSFASNLVPNDTNGDQDIFVRDLRRRTTTRIVSRVGRGAGDYAPQLARWVGDGTRIAFVSWSSDFGMTDTNWSADLYTFNLTNGTYELVSENAAGHDSGRGDSGWYLHEPGGARVSMYAFSASADGSRIAFGSYANDLGPTDGNRSDYWSDHDVYVADLVTTGG
jgi:Tol biopolymer transport system component